MCIKVSTSCVCRKYIGVCVQQLVDREVARLWLVGCDWLVVIGRLVSRWVVPLLTAYRKGVIWVWRFFAATSAPARTSALTSSNTVALTRPSPSPGPDAAPGSEPSPGPDVVTGTEPSPGPDAAPGSEPSPGRDPGDEAEADPSPDACAGSSLCTGPCPGPSPVSTPDPSPDPPNPCST